MGRSEEADHGAPELRLVLRSGTVADIQAAFGWYESQRIGLGSEFLAAVEQTLGSISEHPLRYRVVSGNTRHALVRRFPYRVLYRAVGDEILVIACFHAMRDPETWSTRS